MAKKASGKKKSPPPNELPYVGAAFFCRSVLHEENGVISAIRIIDRIALAKIPPSQEGGVEVLEIYAVVILKSGSVKGPKTIKLFMTTPAGIQAYPAEMPADFQGGGHGVTATVRFGLQPTEEGLWWCDVLVDGTSVTRIPLEVVYQQPPTAKGGGATPPPSAAGTQP